MLTSRLDAYISKYGDFCAHDDNDNNDDNDTTDYFTPLAHARGVKIIHGGFGSTWGDNFYMGMQNGSKLEI